MAPSISLRVSPASSIARRAASAATMRSERPGCGPATTPRPTIAYFPDDGCLGTMTLLATSSVLTHSFDTHRDSFFQRPPAPCILLQDDIGFGGPLEGLRFGVTLG